MRMDGSRMTLERGETFYTLFQRDAFLIEQGQADVYMVRHDQNAPEEDGVYVCALDERRPFALPAFSVRDEEGELWCFAVRAHGAPVHLRRTERTDEGIEAFLDSAGMENAGAWEESLRHACQARTAEDPAVVIGKGQLLIAEKSDTAYYVESGAACVYILPSTAEGIDRQREWICRASPHDDFAIPGMKYENGEGVWRLAIAAENGEARLRSLPCTRVGREKFLLAVQRQGEARTPSQNLMELYENEGFEESLVQYYTGINDLADSIRLNRQSRQREKIEEDIDSAIREGIGKGAAEPAGGQMPLVQALQYLCQRSGIDLPEEEELARRCSRMMLPEIARAAHLICREVELEKNWFRNDCGMLIGWIEGNPVACLPAAGGRYRLFDPRVGRPVRLTAAMAMQIDPKAYSLRRSLPARALGAADLIRFALGGISGSDVLCTGLLSGLCFLAGAFLPVLNQKVCDECIPLGDSGMLLRLCLFAAVFMLGNFLFTLLRNLCTLRIASRAGGELQDAVYARVLEMPESFLRRYESGDLAQRVQAFGGMANRLTEKALGAAFSALFSLVFLAQMYGYAPGLIPAVVPLLCGYELILFAIASSAVGHERTAAIRETESAGRLHQLLSGIQKIRMAGAEEHAVLACIRPAARQQQASVRAGRLLGIRDRLREAQGALFSMLCYAMIVFGGMDLSVGRLLAFGTAFGLFSSALSGLVQSLMDYRLMMPQMELIRPLVQCAPETPEEERREPIDHLEGRVALDHVAFAYEQDGKPVLREISLDVKPGEYVGIVGRSGSGKSTVFRLLLGFETPQSGRVLYDNRDIRTLDPRSLRKRLGVVLQNEKLICGSIYENIVVTAENPSREIAEDAIKRVGLEADIEAMPMHLDTMISETADTISGGQKQRILLARAIAGRPDVLLLDEATSALDTIAQAQICENLERMHVTRIAIAHRLSTVRRCDRIIVMEEGRIVEEGSFEQLCARRGIFYEMARQQLAEAGGEAERQ